MANEKTNAMRILEQAGIKYTVHTYPHKPGVAQSAVDVAAALKLPPEQVYKTLVTRGTSKTVYVFVLPAAEELNLKKAAAVAGEKAVALVPMPEITPLTGYVRGGCSPIGMKKQFKSFLHSAAAKMPAILVSAGKIGWQIQLCPEDLLLLTGGTFAQLT